jgi:hypothetical protein
MLIGRMSDAFQTIAEELRNRGHNTVSFIENPHAGPTNNLSQGFEKVFLKGLNNDGNRYGTISNLSHWLKSGLQSKRSFFLWTSKCWVVGVCMVGAILVPQRRAPRHKEGPRAPQDLFSCDY